MSATRAIEPLRGGFDREVTVPGSKSITNRALVCAGLARGVSKIDGALFADDTEAMIENLRRLGAVIDAEPDQARLTVTGTAGRLRPGPLDLDARLSGTTARFLLPVLATGPGPYRLDGASPLRARPMVDGVDVLRGLGVHVQSDDGRLPVEVQGPVVGDAVASIPGATSSQFSSGVLLAAPTWPDGRRVTIDGPVVSRPYVDMTVAVMRSFGARVSEEASADWRVQGTGYEPAFYAVEPDASAASYFFAAAAVTGSRVRVAGLGADSLQGDLQFARVLEQMGAKVSIGADGTTVEGTPTLRGVTADLRDFSDTAQTLAVVAAFADGPTTITGIGFIRGKETDRIAAVTRELARLGVRVEERDDGLVVHPAPVHGGVVQTYDDHRMAMSFAVAGLRVAGVEIADPGCVAKTFPQFFAVLDTLRT